MENLMNRWKTTVDNHNKKLANMRESSLGASSNQGRRSLSREGNLRSRVIKPAGATEQITDKIAKLNNDIEVLSQKSSEKGHTFASIKAGERKRSNDSNEDYNNGNEQTINLND